MRCIVGQVEKDIKYDSDRVPFIPCWPATTTLEQMYDEWDDSEVNETTWVVKFGRSALARLLHRIQLIKDPQLSIGMDQKSHTKAISRVELEVLPSVHPTWKTKLSRNCRRRGISKPIQKPKLFSKTPWTGPLPIDQTATTEATVQAADDRRLARFSTKHRYSSSRSRKDSYF